MIVLLREKKTSKTIHRRCLNNANELKNKTSVFSTSSNHHNFQRKISNEHALKISQRMRKKVMKNVELGQTHVYVSSIFFAVVKIRLSRTLQSWFLTHFIRLIVLNCMCKMSPHACKSNVKWKKYIFFRFNRLITYVANSFFVHYRWQSTFRFGFVIRSLCLHLALSVSWDRIVVK